MKNIEEANKQFILDDLLCYKCGEIPEVLKVHTDNCKIELKCKNCGVYEILIEEYFKELSENNYFMNCISCNGSNRTLYYCYDCMSNFCENCKNLIFENHNSEHKIIKLNKRKDICPKHSKEFKKFCKICQENFCDDGEQEHKGHDLNNNNNIVKINPNDVKYKDYVKKIEKANEELKKIVNLNKLVLNTENSFENNYFHIQSILNLAKSYKDANKRDSKDIKCLLSVLSKDIDKSIKAIEEFSQKRGIPLQRKAKVLELNGNKKKEKEKLDSQDIKCISQIKFNQLIEIDISENKIEDIEPFRKMSLPFLEFLNLSHNQIKNIEPISILNSKNLLYIFLQNNKIEKIKDLCDSNFPVLKILRIEDNNIPEQEDSLKTLKKKNIEVINTPFEEQTKNFEKKYNKKISGDTNIIDLSDITDGREEMLKFLFLIITYKSGNKINELKLRNTNIKDPSILTRINFPILETLDLAVNRITNLNFLIDMKAKKLKNLYLDNNCVNDIYPIIAANFQNLEVLSLNSNNFDSEEMEKNQGYIELKKKKPNNKVLGIQLKLTDEEHLKKIFDEVSDNENDLNSNNENDINNN